MKTLIIASALAAFAAPAFAIDANHFESPAEAAAYGVTFDGGNVDTTVLYAGIDSVAEMNGLEAEKTDRISTKEVSLKVRGLSLESPAELAAIR